LSKPLLKQPAADRTGGAKQAGYLNFRIIPRDGLGYGIKDR